MELWLEGRTGWLHHFSDPPKGTIRTFGQLDWQLASLLIHFGVICQNEEIVLADLSRSAVSDSVAETWQDERHIAHAYSGSCWMCESQSHNKAFIIKKNLVKKNCFQIWGNDIKRSMSGADLITSSLLSCRWCLLLLEEDALFLWISWISTNIPCRHAAVRCCTTCFQGAVVPRGPSTNHLPCSSCGERDTVTPGFWVSYHTERC